MIRNPLKIPSRYLFMAIPAGLDHWFDSLDAAKQEGSLVDALIREVRHPAGLPWKRGSNIT